MNSRRRGGHDASGETTEDQMDTMGETGVVQKWLVRGGYGYLPSATNGNGTWGDPPPTPTPTSTPTPTVTPTVTPTPTTTSGAD